MYTQDAYISKYIPLRHIQHYVYTRVHDSYFITLSVLGMG